MTVVDDLLLGLGDAPLRQCQVGPRSTAVWGRCMGLASLHQEVEQQAPPPGGSTRQLALQARSEDLVQAAVGVAAINALLHGDGATAPHLEPGNAYQLILERGAGRRVTVVGHFPFVERLRPHVDALWVLELDPAPGDLPASAASEVIPRSDVVAITGSALVNHTLDALLELARGTFVLVLGPTTPLSPVLFDHGVAALGGTVVEHPELMLRQVADGVSFRHLQGVRQVIWHRDRRAQGSKMGPR